MDTPTPTPETVKKQKRSRKKATTTQEVVAVKNPYTLTKREENRVKDSATFALYRDGIFNSSFDNLGEEGFAELLQKYGESSTWVFVAVKRIADAVAQIPLQVVTNAERPQVVKGYDKGLNSIIRKPNPWQSWFDFAEALIISMELTGNGFIELVTAPNGKPYEMYVLNPSRMTIIPGAKEYIKGYIYSVNGKHIAFQPDEIIHIKYHHPANDYYGLSPLTAARVSIEVDRSALEWNQTFLLRGSWPAGSLETENDIGEEELKRLQRQVKNVMQRGKDQAGRVLVLSGGLKYNNLGVTPKDAEWMSARRMSRDEILAIFGVPFAIAGLFSTEQTSARSAGVEQQIKQFYRTTIFAKMEKIIGALNRQLVPLFRENVSISPNYRSVPALQEEVDQELTRAMALKTLVGAGLSLNKALDRLYVEVDKEVWGDVAWLPSTLLPVSSAEAPQPPQSAQPPTPPNTPPNPKNSQNNPDNLPKSIFEDDLDAWDRVLERVYQKQIGSDNGN